MNTQISLSILIKRFWKRASLTWLMVLLEGILLVLMPLVIGWSVDDLMQSRMQGLIQLAGLCTLLLIIGAGRRFYDTRVYAGMYREVSGEMISRQFQKQTSVSKISARTNLFTEFIEFLENAVPDIVNHLMGLSGTLIIIFFIQINVFWLCVAGAILTGLIFSASGNRMLALNKGQNDEFEKQVALIEAKEPVQLCCHFKRLMKSQYSQASTFLAQATLGADENLIENTVDYGIEYWLEDQLNSNPFTNDTYERTTRAVWKNFRRKFIRAYGEDAINGDGNNPALPYKWYFRMAWWQHTLSYDNDHDLVRQRVAQALSELLVISDNSPLELDAAGMANFYDLLYNHAFGDYADLLFSVSMHPCMGVYLSHMNNRKADPSKNIHPDENYAREIMQLFTIGLVELNADGSRKTNSDGTSIPTYNNDDIRELARVFTGLKAHSYRYEWHTSFWDPSYNGTEIGFEDGVDKTYKTVPFVSMTHPMVMDEQYHDNGAKTLLKEHITLLGNQFGEDEIKEVVNKLVSHPNTAPFVAKHLIRQMVTSNPSPDYVRTVADKFGERGDLKAVIREVLRYPLYHPVNIHKGPTDNRSQKLKPPLLRVTQLLRAFRAGNRSGKIWITGESLHKGLGQHVLSSPTVFNFYKPDFTPHGAVEKAGLVAPEFELHDSATSIAYVNLMYYWFFAEYYPEVSTVISSDPENKNAPELDPGILTKKRRHKIHLDFTTELKLARNPARHDELIDLVSLKLTGKTDLAGRQMIKDAFSSYHRRPLWVLQTVVFMIAISPEFTVLEA